MNSRGEEHERHWKGNHGGVRGSAADGLKFAYSFFAEEFLAVNALNSGTDQYGVLACSGGAGCSGNLVFTLLLTDTAGRALETEALPLTPAG